MTPRSAHPPSGARGGIAVDVAAGLGLGLLLGVVVGLSTTPVVAIVVGALTSLLAAFLGLEGAEGSRLGGLRFNLVRIASLGVFAVLGVLFGLWVRINNPLAEAPEAQLARWQRTFPDNPVLAAQMMISERTGLAPATLQFDPRGDGVGVAPSPGAVARGAGLFSTVASRDLCRELDPARFDNDPAKVLQAYDVIAPLAGAASQVRALPDDAQRRAALAGSHAVLCALKDPGAGR